MGNASAHHDNEERQAAVAERGKRLLSKFDSGQERRAKAWMKGKKDSSPEVAIQELLRREREDLSERYTVVRAVASGTTAVVCEVKTPSGDSLAAKFASCRISNQMSRSQVEEMRLMYRNESDLMKRIGEHPHIVRLVEYAELRRHCLFVMEWAPTTLLHSLVTSEIYSETDAAQHMGSIASALEHVHKAGVAHLDIKVRDA